MTRIFLLCDIRQIRQQLLAGRALRHVTDLSVHVTVPAGRYSVEILDQLIVKRAGALTFGQDAVHIHKKDPAVGKRDNIIRDRLSIGGSVGLPDDLTGIYQTDDRGITPIINRLDLELTFHQHTDRVYFFAGGKDDIVFRKTADLTAYTVHQGLDLITGYIIKNAGLFQLA